jgi:hypothetical protein
MKEKRGWEGLEREQSVKKKIITKAYKTIFSPTNTNKTQMNITM